MIALSPVPIDPAELLAEFADQARGAGGIAMFVGAVRQRSDGEQVIGLWLDHHPQITPAVLATIDADTARRFDLCALTLVHRVGALAPGEPIVFVAAAAAHRRAAFDAVDYAMDRLKTELPVWKRETRSDGEHWIEARPADHADRSRWDAGAK